MSTFSDSYKQQVNDVLFRRVGYGLFAFFLAYICALLTLAKEPVARMKRASRHSLLLLFLIIALPYGVYTYISAPYTANFDANLRYCLPVLLLAYLLLVELCKRASRTGYWLLVAALIAEIVSMIGFLHLPDLPFETFTLRYIFISPLLFLGFAAKTLFLVTWGFLFWRFLPRTGLPVLLLLLPAILLTGNGKIAHARDTTAYETLAHKYPFQADLFDAFEWMDEHTGSDAVIAYTGFHLQYPLFNRALTRDVRYVHVSACADCSHVDFQSAPEGIFTGADREAWLMNLRSAGVTYLIYYDNLGLQRYVAEWIMQLPRNFRVAYSAGDVIIYQFTPSP